MPAEVGERAPDFELTDETGAIHRLADYRGVPLVIAFYPADHSAVCTRQLCSYRDQLSSLSDSGAKLLGISPQGSGSHQKFADRHNLRFPLLADTDRSVAKDFGVSAGPLVRRSVFVLDPDGTVRFRKVALIGMTYVDMDEIRAQVDSILKG